MKDLHKIKLNDIVYYYCPVRGMLFSDNAGFNQISMQAFSVDEYRLFRKLIKPIENEYNKSRGY